MDPTEAKKNEALMQAVRRNDAEMVLVLRPRATLVGRYRALMQAVQDEKEALVRLLA